MVSSNPSNRLSKHIVAPSSANGSSDFSYHTRNQHWSHLKTLGQTPLNVLIVGGGIVGAGLLRELSLRNVSQCCLIEKNDFASGTSGASSKLIHAGLRYLEQSWERFKKGNLIDAWRSFVYVFQASNERRVLGQLAPSLIKPKPIYFVISESDGRSLLAVFLGIYLYYAIQLLQGQFFRPPRVIFRKEAMKWIAPELDSTQVRAIYSFWDSETDDARLVVENLQSAHSHGGMALNYVELVRYETHDQLIAVEVRNTQTNEIISLRTKVLINASGAYVDEVRAKNKQAKSSDRYVDRVAGAHLNVFPAVSDESYYVTAGDGRLVFVLHREEDGLVYSRIGTTERPLQESELNDHPDATEKEILYLKELVQLFFPKATLDATTLINADAGIRPLMSQSSMSSFQKSREHRIVHEGPVVHVVGVKLTDFRKVSREVVDGISWAKLGIPISNNTHPVDLQLLREDASPWMYAENSLEEIVRRTMVVKPDDYLYRRRGFRNRVLQKLDPKKLEGEMGKLKKLLK